LLTLLLPLFPNSSNLLSKITTLILLLLDLTLGSGSEAASSRSDLLI
jgi:hypothetical protein